MSATFTKPKAHREGCSSDGLVTPYGLIKELPNTPELRAAMKPKTILDAIRLHWLFFKISGFVTGYDGPGRYEHLRSLCELLWQRPGKEVFKWNPWLETQLEAFCSDNREVLLTGPNSAGKTFGSALYLLNQFYCSPTDTRVSIASTTRDGLKGRIWADFRKLHMSAMEVIGKVGHLVDSDICIQAVRGDSRHGVFGVSIVQGEEKKALGRLIGFHTPRSFVAVDELTDVNWSIITSLTSFFTAKRRAQFIGTGNASFFFDSHGRMCEPEEGWNSITVNSDQWRTKRGGLCVHFNALKSPNVLAHKTVYDFLPTQADIDDTIKKYGENSPEMYRFRYGFWCPEGITRTVLNNSIIAKFQAMVRAVWKDSKQMQWAALDPAFEGSDRCVLRFGWTGVSDTGIDTLELAYRVDGEPDIIHIKIDKMMKDEKGNTVPDHYQIAHKVKAECEARGIPPDRFGMDSTGEGGGLASIISEEWGHGFCQVEFGGKASEMAVSEINSKKRCDEYKNRVCELWHSFRTSVILGQIRGMDPDTALEFCSRQFTVEAKIVLESKLEMKARSGGRSPDLADAAVVLLNTVQRKGALGAALSMTAARKKKEWWDLAEETEFSEPLFDGNAIDAVLI